MFKRSSSVLLRLCAAALMLGLTATSSFGQTASEGQLKAAYLVNFLKYVEWPGAHSTMTICLFGRDSLGPFLAAYEGRQVAGRELRVRRVTSPDQLVDCQALFIPETDEGRYAAVLRWVDKQAILTVSETDSFAREGGAISLVRGEGRLQFDVNADALNKAGLKASSQMLRLARQVIGGAK